MDEDDEAIVIGVGILVQGHFQRLATRGFDGNAIGGELKIDRFGFDEREIGNVIFGRQSGRRLASRQSAKCDAQQDALYLLAG